MTLVHRIKKSGSQHYPTYCPLSISVFFADAANPTTKLALCPRQRGADQPA